MTKYSQTEECWIFDCDYGCHGTDFESNWEAQQAELSHVCRSARR